MRRFGSKTLGARLKILRAEQECSLSEAAREMGYTKSHLWDLESGRSDNPTLSTIFAICRVYDISVQELLSGL